MQDQVTKKSLSEVGQSEPMEATAVASIKKRQAPKENIRASHLIPHSVIKYFMKNAGVAPGSKNVLFGASGTKLGSTTKRTPGTSAVYMLCPSCEHNLSVLGEQAFMSFLEKVYNHLYSDTETVHVYGKEMYHFCIGLILRTLSPSQDEYINTDEVYKLLLQCRNFLTAASDRPPQADSTIPEVFMFICPSKNDDYDMSCAFITQNSASFTAKISLDCRVEELGTFASVLANFFMVKVGTIVIVVKFSPAAKHLIDERFQINPEAGSYSIPASEARREMIPAGIWTVLHLLNKSFETDLGTNEVFV